MKLKWTDVMDIAIELVDVHKDIDPRHLNFVTLRQYVVELSDFDDEADRCGEKILEAIQMAWIEELD